MYEVITHIERVMINPMLRIVEWRIHTSDSDRFDLVIFRGTVNDANEFTGTAMVEATQAFRELDNGKPFHIIYLKNGCLRIKGVATYPDNDQEIRIWDKSDWKGEILADAILYGKDDHLMMTVKLDRVQRISQREFKLFINRDKTYINASSE